MKELNSADYERMMVEAAGGLNLNKPVVQKLDVVAEQIKRSVVVVQDDFSFRDSFFDRIARRGGIVRIVG
ncbi:hypothetical protein KYLE_3 [Pantoea phage Kyle]|uniref:Uncharacterized protein n=1 Tax=Pantoea phage Kyle TaxID=2589665 RepID=A0A514A8R6_9CAUD|nr:hypothetical protein HWC52_gp003 [Pantoea phage Kyle]YP_009849941.1 hypothetical protein HWC52_gp109 [Pantoea phage Kyle]QDH49597.1 hypothetical protein KYLE_109 [Pantoea phage Kyle]QDH49668.1 hypothetical protein KYLE_3 [Pantoea phage Kyle]